MIIRHAILNDVNTITKLTAELGYSTYEQEIENRLIRITNNTDHAVFIAENDGEVLGWIHIYKVLTLESGYFSEIGGLVVSEKSRGKGIGTKLINAAKSWSCEQGVVNIRARSNITRQETHKFYLKLGFQQIKEQIVFSIKS